MEFNTRLTASLSLKAWGTYFVKWRTAEGETHVRSPEITQSDAIEVNVEISSCDSKTKPADVWRDVARELMRIIRSANPHLTHVNMPVLAVHTEPKITQTFLKSYLAEFGQPANEQLIIAPGEDETRVNTSPS